MKPDAPEPIVVEDPPRRPLLIGESPSKAETPADEALRGRIGRRLAALIGISEAAYAEQFDRVNLLPDFIGKRPGEAAAPWPALQARDSAQRIIAGGVLTDRPFVILLGRRVSAAFGVSAKVEWFSSVDKPIGGARVIVAPHPSGASFWWNKPENERAARKFWRWLWRSLRGARTGPRPSVPAEKASKKVPEVPGPDSPMDIVTRDLGGLPDGLREAMAPLLIDERKFVVCYCSTARGNARLAVQQCGVDADRTAAERYATSWMHMPRVRRAIEAWMEAYALGASELTHQLADLAQANVGPFVRYDPGGKLVLAPPSEESWEAHKHWIKEIEVAPKTGRVRRVVLHDALAARRELAKILKLYSDQPILALNVYLQSMSDAQILEKLTELRDQDTTLRLGAGSPQPPDVDVEDAEIVEDEPPDE